MQRRAHAQRRVVRIDTWARPPYGSAVAFRLSRQSIVILRAPALVRRRGNGRLGGGAVGGAGGAFIPCRRNALARGQRRAPQATASPRQPRPRRQALPPHSRQSCSRSTSASRIAASPGSSVARAQSAATGSIARFLALPIVHKPFVPAARLRAGCEPSLSRTPCRGGGRSADRRKFLPRLRGATRTLRSPLGAPPWRFLGSGSALPSAALPPQKRAARLLAAQVLLPGGRIPVPPEASGYEPQPRDGRVGEDVATLTPHRPGRAGFPHPVPHVRALLPSA
jgi:hypothetical protein